MGLSTLPKGTVYSSVQLFSFASSIDFVSRVLFDAGATAAHTGTVACKRRY